MDERLNIKVLLDTTQFKREVADLRSSITAIGAQLNGIAGRSRSFNTLANALANVNTQFNQMSAGMTGIRSLIAELQRLRGSVSDLRPIIRASQRGMREWDDTALKTWASTRGWRQSLYGIGDALSSTVGAFKDVMTLTMEFDTAVRTAAAVSGDFKNAMGTFEEAARKMGETTAFTATQAAGALQMLAMAGLNVKESVEALPSVLNLAIAGNVSIADSADLVTNIMAQYGIQTKDLGRAVDTLAGTFTSSNTSLKELGKAFIYTGSIAKASNQSFEQTNALLGVLANAGYKSGKAGRTLAQSFSRIQRDLPALSKVFEEHGINVRDTQKVYSDNEKQMRPLVDILNDINRAMGDAGKEAGDVGAVIESFGMIAGPGIQALLAQGAEAIKYQEALLYGLNRVEAKGIINELFTYTEAVARGEKATSGIAEKLSALKVNVVDAYGALKSMPQILAELASQGVAASELSNIFGDLQNIKAIEQAYTQVQQSAQAGVIPIKEMQNALAQTAGTGQRVATEMGSGLGGAVKILQSAWESLKLTIGEAFEGRAIQAAQNLTRVLSENRQALADTASMIFNVISAFIEWGISLAKILANSQTLTMGLLVLYGALKVIKLQVVELAAVMLGKMVVGMLAMTGQMALLSAGTATLSGMLAMLKVQGVAAFGGMLGAVKALSVGFYLALKPLALLAGAVGAAFIAVEAFSRLVIGQSIVTSVQDLITTFSVAQGKAKDLADTLKEIDKSKSAADELKKGFDGLKFPDLNVDQLVKYRQEVQNIISTLEGMELADPGSLSPEQLDTLKKYREEYKALNKEFFTEKRQQEIEALKNTASAQKELGEVAKKAGGDVSALIGVYDKFYDSLRKVVDARAENSITKISESLKALEIASLSRGDLGAQELLNAQNAAALQIIAIEEQRVDRTIQLYEEQESKKRELILGGVEDVDEQNKQLLQVEAESIAKRIELQESLKNKISQNLSEALNQQQQYTQKVIELDRSIESEKRRQTEVLNELEREGLSEVELIEAKKQDLRQKASDYNLAIQQGNLDQAIAIAKEEERLALEIGKARKEAGETDVTDETRGAVLEAQNRINEAMGKQREIAEQNRVAQEGQVQALQSALGKIDELLMGTKEAGGLLEQQIKLNVDIIGEDVVQGKIDSLTTLLEKPVEKKLVITPEGQGINEFLNNIKAQIDKLKIGTGFATGKLPGLLKAFATGGVVQGEGTGTSDSILARVSKGEAIIPANVVKQFGNGFFNELIRGNMPIPAFAGGGIVGESGSVNANSQSSMQPININIGSKKIPLYAKADQTKQVLLGLQELLR